MGLKRFFFQFLATIILSLPAVFAVWVGLVALLMQTGLILPANRVEQDVRAWQKTIQDTDVIAPKDIPDGADYVLFSKDGRLLGSTLTDRQYEQAMRLAISNDSQHLNASMTQTYIKITTDTQLLIVTYSVRSSFTNPILNRLFPELDLLLLALLLLFIILSLIVICLRYAKKLEKELLPLQQAAEQIRLQNLEFKMTHPKFREFNRVMNSLDALRDELKHSLSEQWQLQQQQKKQMSALAHDIKTPLTILSGNAQLLLESDLDGEQCEYANFILENTKQIEEYTLRLIDVSRSNQDASHSGSCHPAPLLAQMESNARNLCFQKGLAVCFEVKNLPDYLNLTEECFKRAIWNLIDNAIQYSPKEGTIYVHAYRSDPSDASEPLTLEVADEGPGFSREALQFATDEFFRDEKSRSDKTHFGLGLSIVNQIITSAGGTLSIQNNEKGGALVRIRIKVPPIS